MDFVGDDFFVIHVINDWTQTFKDIAVLADGHQGAFRLKQKVMNIIYI